MKPGESAELRERERGAGLKRENDSHLSSAVFVVAVTGKDVKRQRE